MYEVTIKESSKELTAKERIALKDTSDAVKLDEATTAESLVIKPVAYAILNVVNDKADDPEYSQYVVIADDGTKYVTGSESFWNSFINIFEEMKDESEEWAIKVYRLDSKNYKGKQFITCSII